jgi:hypothetical protein
LDLRGGADPRANNITLFASLELSKSKWVVTINNPGSEKFSKHVIEGGDGAGLLELLSRSRAKAEQRYGVQVKAIVIQEAGLDGFWIHRLLLANGIESHVVDAASIAVDRRHRRVKTDAIDGETLLRTLMAWARSERRVCSMVRAPRRRRSPAPDARARHAAQGTHSAYQSGQGPALRLARNQMQPDRRLRFSFAVTPPRISNAGVGRSCYAIRFLSIRPEWHSLEPGRYGNDTVLPNWSA